MTPAELRTLKMLQGQSNGARAHLSETGLRLQAMVDALQDVASAVVVAKGIDNQAAAELASHLQAEVSALQIVGAQLAMALALGRVLIEGAK